MVVISTCLVDGGSKGAREMTEDQKAIWKEIYTLADSLAINRERLKYLVEDIIGKRAETIEAANTVQAVLEAVDSKFKNRLLPVGEAIEETKGEHKKDSKGEVQVQGTLGEPTDEEVEQIGAELEEEVRRKDIEEIKKLVDDLGISEEELEAIMETYKVKNTEELNAEQAEDLKDYLENKRDVREAVEADRKVHKEIMDIVSGFTNSNDGVKFFHGLHEKYGVVSVPDLDFSQKEEVLKQLKAVQAEVVVEEHWDKTVEIDEGTFMFRGKGGKVLCKNGANDNVYELKVDIPKCSCKDFEINKQKQEWCKHLKAASVAGYPVKELTAIPEGVSEALVKPEKKKQKKVKKEEVVALTVMGETIQIPVQTPAETINNEEAAVKMIQDIAGLKPRYEDVIERYGEIEEISADVILSLAQYAGVRFQIFNKEVEKAKMNLGQIFLKIPMSEDKRKRYEPLVEFMPDTDVTVRCKITSVAAWQDKAGNLRLGVGTKEEHLTPYELRDIVLRGANFIETKCESKASKKSIINALPITHDGLLSKIKETYGWE